MSHPGFGADLPAVFPDWSPYPDLDSAAGACVLSFTLERFVNETNGVWQEVAVCDGTRLVLWHGEDVPPGEGPAGSMTSSLRVVPVSAVTEVGCRRRLIRSGTGQARVDSVDVYLLLSSLDEGVGGTGGTREEAGFLLQHD